VTPFEIMGSKVWSMGPGLVLSAACFSLLIVVARLAGGALAARCAVLQPVGCLYLFVPHLAGDLLGTFAAFDWPSSGCC